MQVIVHGGAGASPDDPEARQAVLDDAAATGADADAPLDAVTAAVRALESNPRFNAGVGGSVQSDGAIRTDAGLMTDEREVGAVASLPGVEHAVSAARVVLEETPHVLVAGDRAVELAADYGVETDCDLWTERTRERWADVEPPDGGPADHLAWLRERFGGIDAGTGDGTDHDTVGAVAREGDRLAAATSTGGRWLALAGRVGDVPQVGSGFYCAPAGGASATGAGEDIARVTLARRAVRRLERGDDAAAAADAAIESFGEITGSDAGVIVLGRDGSVGSAFNSDAMQTATAKK
ncbi:isoaspartyl peptidase/L-asparaginase [Halostella litorea]|uniref:isoaspartyl peptidase/L-asparaginase n=1 Tax=Halostella litorea TaxID=2528831 RepID=UPI0010924990|nr:isoaspartyl peptidase/L-asparaginase [Halostella litorea]